GSIRYESSPTSSWTGLVDPAAVLLRGLYARTRSPRAALRARAGESLKPSDVLNIRTAAIGGSGAPGSGIRPQPAFANSTATHRQTDVHGPRNSRTGSPAGALA